MNKKSRRIHVDLSYFHATTCWFVLLIVVVACRLSKQSFQIIDAPTLLFFFKRMKFVEAGLFFPEIIIYGLDRFLLYCFPIKILCSDILNSWVVLNLLCSLNIEHHMFSYIMNGWRTRLLGVNSLPTSSQHYLIWSEEKVLTLPASIEMKFKLGKIVAWTCLHVHMP